MNINRVYPKSVYGVFKYMEFAFSLLAGIFCFVSFNGGSPQDYPEWGMFFFFTHLTSVIVLPIVFLVFLLTEKSQCVRNITVMLVHLSLAVCGLVTTSYWAKRAEDTLQINRDKYWAYLLVSVVFGFMSSVLLVVDFVLSYRKVRGYAELSEYNCRSREDIS